MGNKRLDIFALACAQLFLLLLVSVLVGSHPAAEAQGQGLWSVSTVDFSHLPTSNPFEGMMNHSLQLDSGGLPHVAYGGIRLYYARKVGANWIAQEIDNLASTYVSLAVDKNDQAHISYVSDKKLKYAAWDGAQWVKETVDSRGGVYTSIALDSSDSPQISYCSSDGLMLARRNGSGWATASVGINCDEGGISLAFDGNGYAHISLIRSGIGEGGPTYAHWNGTVWSTETLTHTLLAGQFNSIALDNNAHPHITFYDRRLDSLDPGGLIYNHWNGSIWVQTRIAAEAQDTNVGEYSSIAVDGNGHPHISYVVRLPGTPRDTLRYAYYNGTGWSTRTVESGSGQQISNTSITVDLNGQPHIAYQQGADMKYAYWNGSSWVIETADDGGTVGIGSSLAIDGGGYPHIGYIGDNYLRYAKWNGSGWDIQEFDKEPDWMLLLVLQRDFHSLA